MTVWPEAYRGQVSGGTGVLERSSARRARHSRPDAADDLTPTDRPALLDRLFGTAPHDLTPAARRVLCGAVVHVDELSGRVLRCTRDDGHAGLEHDNLGAQVLTDWAESGGAALLTSPIPVTPLGQTIQTIMSHIRSYEGVRQWRLERGMTADAAAAFERAEALRLLVRTLGR
ncbi:hypothetical protein QQX09_09640 [Demequina sp. SYSU T00192]|uniref:Uncharacterized protein n=1 Tax=Demequina litoralis TaxID=3051660 RepID=A0ABT8GAE9_9MICO|nr:hypothetical protein [Demequina sp. SYSU T00192]MDN4476115.1 hypothetical protein [Demequina sp. SYSU T00192]